MKAIRVPFSVRQGSQHLSITNDFPKTARVALLHILDEAVDFGYIKDWNVVSRELQRLARLPPQSRKWSSSDKSKSQVEEILDTLPWDKVLDFCELLFHKLAQEAWEIDNQGFSIQTATLGDARSAITESLQGLFLEERLGFEFVNGNVQFRGRLHSVKQIESVGYVLTDPRLEAAKMHYTKALRYFRDAKHPDPANAVKEAVCAVESTVKALFPDLNTTHLDTALKKLSRQFGSSFPPTILKTFAGTYEFRGDSPGVAHGGSTLDTVTPSLAEYVLAVTASQITLLVDLANTEDSEVPF